VDDVVSVNLLVAETFGDVLKLTVQYLIQHVGSGVWFDVGEPLNQFGWCVVANRALAMPDM